MNSSPKKGPGRPKGNPETKAIKPNISIRRDLIAEAEAAAQKRGMGLSEYATMALTKQVARDEDLAATGPLFAMESPPGVDQAKAK